MAICSNCKREVDLSHQFCGYCGANLKTSVNVVIDGRKDKRIKYLINRVCHFEKTNIMFTLLFLALAVVGIFVLAKSIPDIIQKTSNLKLVMWQLKVKYDYMKEGLGLNYLYGETKFILNFSASLLLCLTAGIMTLISIYFAVFNTDIMILRRKYRESYSYKKPMRFIKVTFYITKISFILIVLLAVMWIILAGLYTVFL